MRARSCARASGKRCSRMRHRTPESLHTACLFIVGGGRKHPKRCTLYVTGVCVKLEAIGLHVAAT
eukprot:3737950-Rhodomonas_salina.2